MNVIPQDIIDRITRRKPYWLQGPPKISLFGKAHEFGTLEFDFTDEIVSYKVYIADHQKLLAVAEEAITMINAKSTGMRRI